MREIMATGSAISFNENISSQYAYHRDYVRKAIINKFIYRLSKINTWLYLSTQKLITTLTYKLWDYTVLN